MPSITWSILIRSVLALQLAMGPTLYGMEQASPETIASSPQEQSEAQSAPILQRKKRKKKPTLLESWRKVFTLKWKKIDKSDKKNIIITLAGCAATACLSYCGLSLIKQSKQSTAPNNNKGNTSNTVSITKPNEAKVQHPLSQPTDALLLEPSTIAITKSLKPTPCIAQGGLNCGYHALFNVQLMLENLQQCGDLPEACLYDQTAQDRLQQSVFDLGNPDSWQSRIKDRRAPGFYKESIYRMLTSCLSGTFTDERNILRILTTKFCDIVIVQKETIIFWPNDITSPSKEDLAKCLATIVNASPEDPNHKECMRLFSTYLDVNKFKEVFGNQLHNDQDFVGRTSQYKHINLSNLWTDDITYLCHDTNSFSQAQKEMITVIVDSTTATLGNPYLIHAIKTQFTSALQSQQVYTHGFVIRTGGKEQHFNYIKKSQQYSQEPGNCLECHQDNIKVNHNNICQTCSEPRINKIMQEYCLGDTHWVALVVHQDAQGKRSYYTADSVLSPYIYPCVQIVIDALQFDPDAQRIDC